MLTFSLSFPAISSIDNSQTTSTDGSSGGLTFTISVPPPAPSDSSSEAAEPFLHSAQLGDSICINGTCLTITTLPSPSTFTVGVVPETLRRTNLGQLDTNSRVNLERSVTASTRMGGHFVQGHVDCTATIASVTPDGDGLLFRFQLPQQQQQNGAGAGANAAGYGYGYLTRYIVEKGYVCVDGASLTVTAVNDREGWFEIMFIKYTSEKVVTASKKAGDKVNVEIDIVGKYVERSVEGYLSGLLAPEEDAEAQKGGTQTAKAAPPILEKMIERIVDRRVAQLTAR